jgi:ElaB/YqjD/DUF883 family membrane-anchored ribosome-binding protein
VSRCAEDVLKDLHGVLDEVGGVLRGVLETTEGPAAEAVERLQEATARATHKLAGLKKTLRRDLGAGIRSTERYVEDNPWVAIGVAAAAAFVLGALVARRD